jgi:hypothetical protein
VTSTPDLNSANTASREALRALVARLTDQDLARDLGEGWTVAGMLAHLGFYDARVLALLRRWEAGTAVGASPLDAEAVNQAKQPYFQLLPARAAADLTLRLADECDAAVAALTPDRVAQIAAAGSPARLDRAHHRWEHIEQIERALHSG